ncbi:hypothetical protein EDB89DRAFT_2147535 [Lactarius sanguifluus]|nr:hypothetical protein EDB89DRAFT_2147535 [Lactarius sanguifluus]
MGTGTGPHSGTTSSTHPRLGERSERVTHVELRPLSLRRKGSSYLIVGVVCFLGAHNRECNEYFLGPVLHIGLFKNPPAAYYKREDVGKPQRCGEFVTGRSNPSCQYNWLRATKSTISTFTTVIHPSLYVTRATFGPKLHSAAIKAAVRESLQSHRRCFRGNIAERQGSSTKRFAKTSPRYTFTRMSETVRDAKTGTLGEARRFYAFRWQSSLFRNTASRTRSLRMARWAQ